MYMTYCPWSSHDYVPTIILCIQTYFVLRYTWTPTMISTEGNAHCLRHTLEMDTCNYFVMTCTCNSNLPSMDVHVWIFVLSLSWTYSTSPNWWMATGVHKLTQPRSDYQHDYSPAHTPIVPPSYTRHLFLDFS
jgi:hypothetical protein